MQLINYNNVNIEDEKLYFHFSPKSNRKSIEENGLIANIGNNAKGFEDKKRVYFSKTEKGALQIFQKFIDNCISRALNKNNGNEDINNLYEKYLKNVSEVDINDEEQVKKCAYSMAAEYFRNADYYLLNLKSTTYDEFEKMNDDEKKKIDFISDDTYEDGTKMANANMHTIEGKNIDINKVFRIVINKNENSNALDTVLYLIEKNKEKDNIPKGIYASEAFRKNTEIDNNKSSVRISEINGRNLYMNEDGVAFIIDDNNNPQPCYKKENMIEQFYKLYKSNKLVDLNNDSKEHKIGE